MGRSSPRAPRAIWCIEKAPRSSGSRPGPARVSPPDDLGAETAGDDGRYTITTGTPTHSLNRLTGWALERAIELEELSVSTPTLEDVFIELVGAFERGGEEE